MGAAPSHECFCEACSARAWGARESTASDSRTVLHATRIAADAPRGPARGATAGPSLGAGAPRLMAPCR